MSWPDAEELSLRRHHVEGVGSCKASGRAPGPSCEAVLRFQSFELHVVVVRILDEAAGEDASADEAWAAG